MLRVNVLGIPGLVMNEVPMSLSPSATMMCVYLALAPRDGRPRTLAASHLFGDCPEASARRRLNTAVWRLKAETRSTTGVDLVTTTPGGHGLALSTAVDVTVDAEVFADLVEPALTVKPADLAPEQVSALEHAVSLRRGQLLEPCHDDWVMPARFRIENLYLTALDYLVQHHGARGSVDRVVAYGELALELEPLREDLHRHLMLAYGAAARPDMVERQYERCRRLLVEELGADPLPETTATYTRLVGDRLPSMESGMVAGLLAELERAGEELAHLSGILERARARLRQQD